MTEVTVIVPAYNHEKFVLETLNSINNQTFKNIKVIIIDDCSVDNTSKLIEKYTDAKILGVMPHFENLKNINPNDLITNVLTGIDIESVFDIKIAKLDS